MQENKVNTAGPAFPLPSHTRKWDAATQEYLQDEGMTLRDYFAAKAMQGFCAGAEAGDALDMLPELAYMVADAMIKARSN